jgi:hypothetical protein
VVDSADEPKPQYALICDTERERCQGLRIKDFHMIKVLGYVSNSPCLVSPGILRPYTAVGQGPFPKFGTSNLPPTIIAN